MGCPGITGLGYCTLWPFIISTSMISFLWNFLYNRGFLRYGLRERLRSWGFFLCWNILCNHFFTHHFNRQKWWVLLPGKMLSSTWLEMLLRNVLKSFWKPVPLDFSNPLFCFEGSYLPAPAFCSFSLLPDSYNTHLGQVIITAERKTKILTPGPQKGWVIEFSLESVFAESQLCAYYWFMWCRKYLYHYWQVLISTK